MRSEDGGQRWSEVVGATTADWFQSVAFASDGRSALAVEFAGTVFRSADGGQRWREVARAKVGSLRSVAFAPDGRGALAVGAGRGVLRSEDGGQLWSETDSTTNEGLISVSYAPDGRSALAVGQFGTVIRSEDGGQRWSEVARATKPLHSVAFASDGRSVLAVGEGGTVFRSEDGGQRWSEVARATKAWLWSVAFAPDGHSALAVGLDGRVLRSEDGGQLWEVAGAASAWLRSVAFAPDGRSALAVGDDGTVLRSKDGGKTWMPGAQYQRQPAPWFWAWTLLVLTTAGAAATRYRKRQAARSTWPGLLDNGVSDQPITRQAQDRLAFTPAVEALTEFLRHAATKPSLAIAINAAWGMGKSSFMHMLTEQLEARHARPVWFNVWHHQHEEVLLAPLLQAIAQQAIPPLTQWQGWVFRTKLFKERWRHPSWGVWLGSAALLSVPAYLFCLGLRSSDSSQGLWLQRMADRCVRDVHMVFDVLTGGEWIAAAKSGGLGDVAAAAFKALREDSFNGWLVLGVVLFLWCWFMLLQFLLRPFPANPAILLAGLNKRFSLSQAEAQTDFRQRFRRHFGEVTRALQPRTMTIFIDDLDRCKPDKAAELLEAVNYLSDAGPCFVVLGIARDIVEAQIASAHKTLAEEQAAMERARAVQRAPADATTAAAHVNQDRLVYARKYLRKLVQLDVRLPTLEGEQALKLLLDRPEPPSAESAPKRERVQIWRRVSVAIRANAVRVLVWGTPLALATLLGLQFAQTLEKMETERGERQKSLRGKVDVQRTKLEEARVHENWLRRMAEAKSTKEPDPTGALLFKARADVVQLYVKAQEQALPLLEHEAEVGNEKTYTALVKTKLEPAQQAVESYAKNPQPDGRAWKDIRSGLQPAVAAASAPLRSPAPIRPAGERPEDPAKQRAAGEGEATPDAGIAWWPLEVGLFPVLLAAFLAWRLKDDYTVMPTPQYEAAVAQWQRELLKDPDTASPRELKRFMNLSRYAVARLRRATAGTAPPDHQGTVPAVARLRGANAAGSAAPDQELPVHEARVVEFTARWLLARGRVGTGNLIDTLAGTQATAAERREAALFLQVVGDIDGGELEHAGGGAAT